MLPQTVEEVLGCLLQLFQTLTHDKNLLRLVSVPFSTEEEIKFASIL